MHKGAVECSPGSFPIEKILLWPVCYEYMRTLFSLSRRAKIEADITQDGPAFGSCGSDVGEAK